MHLGLADLIVGLLPFLLDRQHPTPLHQAKMLGGNMTANRACFSQLPHRPAVGLEQEKNFQAHGMSQGPQALSRLRKGF